MIYAQSCVFGDVYSVLGILVSYLYEARDVKIFYTRALCEAIKGAHREGTKGVYRDGRKG